MPLPVLRFKFGWAVTLGVGEARLSEPKSECVACCGDLQQPHPSPRGEQGEEPGARVGGVAQDLSCPPQCSVWGEKDK